MEKHPPLYRNLLTYLGFGIAVLAFIIGVVLIIAEVTIGQSNPYNSLVTYFFIPLLITLGVAFIVFGLIMESRRRKKGGSEEDYLPVINFNVAHTRNYVLISAILLTIFFSVSAVAMYRAFVYTESVSFCGTMCHQIMEPEYSAHQLSPHARVSCVNCHIGEGAEWYVRSKMSGLRQVYRTILGTYELPIKVPIENLRPARETCEHCHWPEKFTGSVERVQWHFWQDDENTPSKYHILMKVGGANRETGKAEGIHWHISRDETVRYWPKDHQRLEIPWVEVTHANGRKTVYTSGDIPEGGPPEEEIRVMDCIDCHNRPAHIYRPPDEMINRALAAGTLDRNLPAIKMNALELLKADYENKDSALIAIRKGMEEAYPGGDDALYKKSDVGEAVQALTKIYDQTQFPNQKINWKTYPNHIGHRTFPGCFRCHNDEHADKEGNTISMDCGNCHDFVFQAHGDDSFGPVTYETQPFQHPGGLEDIWEGSMCTDCHAPDVEM